MDVRVYILLGLLVLLALLIVSLLGALIGYWRALSRAAQARRAGELDRQAEPRVIPIERVDAQMHEAIPQATSDDPFATAEAEAGFGAPLRTGAWRPDGEGRTGTAAPSSAEDVIAAMVASLEAETPPVAPHPEAPMAPTAFVPLTPAPTIAPTVSSLAEPTVVPTVEPPQLVPPVEPSRPTPATEPVRSVPSAEPMPPVPALGPEQSTALAQPGETLRPPVVSEPLPAAAPVSAPASAARREAEEYRLVAPVELHFTVGEGRVGVRPGTATYAEFQRLAKALLDDVRRALERPADGA